MKSSTAVLPLILLVACCAGRTAAQAPSREEATVQAASKVLAEMMEHRDSRIPESMLIDAHGLVIVPDVVKGGFVVGVRHGKGVALVRDEQGVWQAPIFVSLTGGSIGWQIGLQATDVILVFKTQKSVRGLLSGKFTIGADAAAAAGPVGRQAAAATDVRLGAEIYSYSRSRGLFAGLSLDGSALQVDAAAAQGYYQAPASPPSYPASSPTQLPASAAQLMVQVAQLTNTGQPVAIAPITAAPSDPALAPAASPAPAGSPAVDLRRQLAAASQRLQPLLDENWKRYLALPSEVYGGTTPPSSEALREAVGRFDAVAKNAQYAPLAQRAEFQTTDRLLRDYLRSRQSESSPVLELPPPPGRIEAMPAPSTRY